MLVMKGGTFYWVCAFLLWHDRLGNLKDHYKMQASSDPEFLNRLRNIAVLFEDKTFRNSATQVVILIKFQTPLDQSAVCKMLITYRFGLCSRKYAVNFFGDLFLYQPWFGDSYVLFNFLCCQLSTEFLLGKPLKEKILYLFHHLLFPSCFSFYQYNWLFFPM